MIANQTIISRWILKGLGVLFTILISFYSNAQDKKVEIDIGVDREPVWYQQPWAWVLGAAIFILLLVALLRGTRKR